LKIALIILLAGLLELMLFMAWENSVSTLKGDAAAINMVASERMRLMKMALLAEHYAEGDAGVKIQLDNEIAIFESILYGLRDGNPRYSLKKADEPEMRDRLNQNIDRWNKTIKPMLQNLSLRSTGRDFVKVLKQQYREKVFEFTQDVDSLVTLLGNHSERKIGRLHKLQFVFLLITGLIALGSLIFVYLIIIKPIKKLVEVSKAIASGNLAQRIAVQSRDEIGDLGNTFNEMALQLKTNINNLHRQTSELEGQKAFLDSIIDNLPFNIYIVDRNLTVIAWNRYREDGLFGISRDVAIGKKLWNILDMNLFKASSPKNRAEMEREFDEVFKTGKIIEREEVSVSFGGKRFFKVTKIPLAIKEGEAEYVITALEDITERRVLEAQLMARNRLAAIGELAAGVAHEINNPMASMAVCVESLLKSTIPDNFKAEGNYQRFHKYLKIIEDEIYRCKNITTGLLNFSKESSLVVKDVSINDVLNETIKLIQLQKKFSSFIVRTNLEDNLPMLVADEGQLRQVFLAIMINAFEAMEPGRGVLTISTVSSVNGEKNLIKILFQDNGCGIPPENLNKVFTTFFTTKGHTGTGLGLSICYGIINQHGGKIEVESEVDKGSIFSIIFPVNNQGKKVLQN